jgi:hypothetical protein
MRLPVQRSAHSPLVAAVVLAAVTLTTSGCAIGNTHTFNYRPDPGENVGNGKVVVVFEVEDLRKDILEGDEPLSWVGEQRSGYGIPYTIKTTDGKAFAEVVRETIQRDLEAAGFRTTPVDETTPQNVSRFLEDEGAERGLVVVMRVFNSDTYTDIDVEWDFQATVYGPSGRELATNRLQGKEELQGSFMNPPKAAKQKVPPYFYQLMRELVVGNTEMMAALTGDRGDANLGPAPGDRRCTVEQIVKMRDAGLSEEQIEAACGERPPGR